jgi:hypothetical protein
MATTKSTQKNVTTPKVVTNKKVAAPKKVTTTKKVTTKDPEPLVQRNGNLLRNIVFYIVGLLVILALIFAVVWLGKQAFAPVSTRDDQQVGTTNVTTKDSEPEAPIVSGISEDTILDFGSIGSYHAVYDYNRNQWTLGIWPEAQINAGDMNLADLKIKGGTIEFVMPFDGVVNNSAGTVKVNNQAWTLGNPIQDSSGNTLVAKGSLVTISYGENNDSAGFQIWFK